MTILPKKTSQRPPGGGGGASAEGAQEHQHPQGGHFNISSQVGKGKSYKPYLEEPAHNEIYPDCTPPIPCAENGLDVVEEWLLLVLLGLMQRCKGVSGDMY